MLDSVTRVGPASKITVLNPVGYPPKVTKKTAAPRLESLDGKTIYLVDCRFDDLVELLKQVQAWFAEHMPSVKTRIVSLSATYQHDDPKTWEEIKANGDAAIVGVGHCSTCAPGCRHPRHHARDPVRRADGRAPHRQVRPGGAVGDQDGGLPEARRAFVPQPVMGKSADELSAYVYGNDPVTGRPVMQEIIAGLTSMLDGA